MSRESILPPVLGRYAGERAPGQTFENWCDDVGVRAVRVEMSTEQWMRDGRAT